VNSEFQNIFWLK